MLLAASLIAGAALAEEGARITITGEGRVAAVPDMATVTLGVSAEAPTARAAMDETSAGVAALMATLAEAGIEPRDVQTSGLFLNPVWTQPTSGAEPPRITGFSAANTVTVRVRAIEGLGGVLDGVLDAGANTFQGLSFGLQDPEPRLDEARQAAVADARRKAELIATAAGVTLGEVVSIAEDQGMASPAPMFRMEAAMADAVPVAAGETLVTARVTIVWEIGD
jgi:hypothetical protein